MIEFLAIKAVNKDLPHKLLNDLPLILKILGN